MTTRRRTAAAALALTTVLAAACSAAPDDDAATSGEAVEPSSAAPGGWDCGDDCEWDAPADVEIGATGGAEADVAARSTDEGAPAPAPTTTAVGPEDLVDEPVAPEERPSVTAGSIDDNDAWEDYLLYRQWFDRLSPRPEVLDIRVEGRQVLTVVDVEGRPVPGAAVLVRSSDGAEVARLSTYADGRAVFHAPVDEVDPSTQQRATFEAVVTPPSWMGGEPLTTELEPGAVEQVLTLEGTRPDHDARVDIAFLVDATGSMGDEIERLKANMVSMAEQIAAMPGTPDVRFAVTVYRDHGDAFVTRTFDFTGDVAAFSEALRAVEADGGGDRPEALEEGLHDVRTQPAWRGDDTLKMVFLVADAPPHVGGEGPAYDDDVVAAAAEGVKVFPIASSGLADDPQGEYVFRQLAQVTMGRFVFLTYGADGASPGTSTEHQVAPDDYSVLPLDELVVQLVADELAALAS